MEEAFQIENMVVEDFNHFEYENKEVKNWFDLEDILSFQMKHVVQVVRGEDFQFSCWIDNKCYANSLTFLHALVVGIHQFKRIEFKNQGT